MSGSGNQPAVAPPTFAEERRWVWWVRMGVRTLGRFMAKKRLGAFGLVMVVVFVVLAVFAGTLGRYEPGRVFKEENPDFKPNATVEELAQNPDISSPEIVTQFAPPSADHWFGTDGAGRDIYARVVKGAQLSLTIGFAATAITVGLGLILGVISGFYAGVIDLGVQRVVDALQAFPFLVLLLLVVQIAEPSVRNVVIALGIVGIPYGTRIVRAATLSVRGAEYVTAGRVVGASDLRILLRYVLPNIAASVIIIFSIGIGGFILAESSLAFLGVGPADVVSWGKMVSEGRSSLDLHPWQTVFAGSALTLLVVSVNFLGDALRDVLDPRLRGV